MSITNAIIGFIFIKDRFKMNLVGKISKLIVKPTTPVDYSLPIGDSHLHLNPLLGKKIALAFLGVINCMGCDRPIKKSYQQGYCFPCTQQLARCDLCIVRPERCHYHLGTCREPKWGDTYCKIPHWVYLANSSSLKVGITRKSQAPTRWIDQGALQALPLFEVPTRRISGVVEVLMGKFLNDKTNWRQMLQGKTALLDLITLRDEFLYKLSEGLQKILVEFGDNAVKSIENASVYHFDYPVIEYPQKIKSLGFDKNQMIEGTLLGIKGQYLIFDHGVLNIRKHSGYKIEFSTCLS